MYKDYDFSDKIKSLEDEVKFEIIEELFNELSITELTELLENSKKVKKWKN